MLTLKQLLGKFFKPTLKAEGVIKGKRSLVRHTTIIYRVLFIYDLFFETQSPNC